jgi:hypothetical protein
VTLLQILAQDGGRVSAVHSDGSESDVAQMRLSGPDRKLLALFQDWLWYIGPNGERKITRRKELEVFGHLLYDALFPGPVSEFFEGATSRRDVSRDNRLRVELSFRGEAQSIAALPWEFLYRPESPVRRGYFLATSPHMSLARYMPLDAPAGPLAPEDPPLRILATASKPHDQGPVREAATLEQIAGLRETLSAEVEVLEIPTVNGFADAVARVRPHVVHLIAHGTYDAREGQGALALMADDGGTALVSDFEFSELFAQVDVTPRIVFLHACEGGTVGMADLGATFAGLAPMLIRYGVQAVVAMQYPVTNGAAAAFSAAFYGAISEGQGVDTAVQEARARMTIERPGAWDSGEFGIPVLYMRSSDGVMGPVVE